MDEAFQGFVDDFLKPERPPRDKGRPLLIPRGVEALDANRVPYSRASSLGDYLEDDSFLWKWRMRGAVHGVASHMDLVRLAAAENYTCGFTDDIDANRASGRRLDVVIERGMDRAGISMKADYGTAIHLRTEPDGGGVDPDEKQAEDVASCLELWQQAGVHHLATEVFTAADETRSAGTFDHLDYVPGYGILVTDKKTSAKASSSYKVQLSTYSHGDIYDPETDQRISFEDYIARLGWDPGLFNPNVGLVWWVKDGRTEARLLNLAEGWEAAKIAAWVRDNPRKWGVAKNVTKDVLKKAAELRFALKVALIEAPDVTTIYTLYGQPQNQAIWTEEHTEAAKTRKVELTKERVAR